MPALWKKLDALANINQAHLRLFDGMLGRLVPFHVVWSHFLDLMTDFAENSDPDKFNMSRLPASNLLSVIIHIPAGFGQFYPVDS